MAKIAVAALETAFADYAKAKGAVAANSDHRNDATRRINIEAVKAFNAGSVTVAQIMARDWEANGESEPSDETKAKTDGTWAKEKSQWSALETAAKSSLDKLLAAWPDGWTKNDDGKKVYKAQLTRQQFVDIAVAINSGRVDNSSGLEIAASVKAEAKAKAQKKRVASNPAKATDDDLASALLQLCGAAAARPSFKYRKEAMALMLAIDTPQTAS